MYIYIYIYMYASSLSQVPLPLLPPHESLCLIHWNFLFFTLFASSSLLLAVKIIVISSAASHSRAASHICCKSSTASQASLQQAHSSCSSKSSTPVSRPFLKSSTHTFLYFSFSFFLYPLVLNPFSVFFVFSLFSNNFYFLLHVCQFLYILFLPFFFSF